VSSVVEKMLGKPGAAWATGGILEIDALGGQLREIPPRRFSRRRLLRNNIILHPATFVRRDSFESVGGFDVELKYAMDYDLWLRLARLGDPIIIDQNLACFRVHAGSLSSTNRLAVLKEEYQVRSRYLNHPLSRLMHACYHRWRCARVHNSC
jgi:GT2 family glycosyltransferase